MSTPLARTRAWILTLALLAGGVLLFFLPTRETQVVARGGPNTDSPRRADPDPALDAVTHALDLPSSRATGARETAEGVGGLTTPAEGSIRGVVLGPTGQPHEGALCSLRPGLAPLGLDSVLAEPAELVPASIAQTSTHSDSSGRFELPAPPGHWRLSVVAPETRRYEEDHLAAGAFRWIRLEPAVELVVRVFDEAEAPLASARVELLLDAYAPSFRAISFATTERDGSARLAPPAGRWTLAVRHPDHRPHFEPLDLATGDARVERTVALSTGIRVHGQVSIGESAPPLGTRVALDSLLMFQESRTIACEADGSFDSGHVFSSEQVLEVTALVPGFGELRKELDFAGMPADHEVEVLLPVDRPERVVRGRVVDTEGAPIGDASLFLKPLLALAAETGTPLPEDAERLAALDLGGAPEESYQAQWRWSSRTGTEGEFRVGGLDFRRPYSLLVVSPARANARRWIDAAPTPSELDLGTIVLPAGGGLHGVVRARDGSSVAGLSVSTIWIERVSLRAGTTFLNRRPSALTTGFQTSTRQDGSFALRPLPAGEYELVVASESFGPFEVLDGEERGPEMLEIGAASNETDTLSGRMVDDHGQAIDGCLVQLFHAPKRGGLTLLSATSAGAAGDFQLAAPPGGPFVFRAFDLGGAFQAHDFPFEDAEHWRGGEIALLPQPDPGLAIAGRGLGPDRVGLANLRVTLHVSPIVTGCTCVSRSAITAADGSFSFGPIVPGTHRLVVLDPEGRFSPQEKFPVQPGDPLELVLEE